MRCDPRRRAPRTRRTSAVSAVVPACLPACLLACLSAAVLAPPGPAAAEEPLFLRIRPQGASPAEIGSGGADPLSDAEREREAARRARAAREAVWERANARARVVIASVCTGCMKPLPPAPKAPPEAAPASAEAGTPAGTFAALQPRAPETARNPAPRPEGAALEPDPIGLRQPDR